MAIKSSTEIGGGTSSKEWPDLKYPDRNRWAPRKWRGIKQLLGWETSRKPKGGG